MLEYKLVCKLIEHFNVLIKTNINKVFLNLFFINKVLLFILQFSFSLQLSDHRFEAFDALLVGFFVARRGGLD